MIIKFPTGEPVREETSGLFEVASMIALSQSPLPYRWAHACKDAQMDTIFLPCGVDCICGKKAP